MEGLYLQRAVGVSWGASHQVGVVEEAEEGATALHWEEVVAGEVVSYLLPLHLGEAEAVAEEGKRRPSLEAQAPLSKRDPSGQLKSSFS